MRTISLAVAALGASVLSSGAWAARYDPSSGWALLADAEWINDVGQIAGLGVIGGEAHAFLLTPVPEPGSWAMMMGGLGIMGGGARARGRKA